MAKKPTYDDLETDYFDEEVGSSFLGLITVGIAFIVVGLFIALAWYAYQDDEPTEDGVTTIYAEDTPMKVTPEEESGWRFPDGDRHVYNLGSDRVEDMKVEQILPQPERPQIREEQKTEGWINNDARKGPVGLTDAERRQIDEPKDIPAATPQVVKEITTPTPKPAKKVTENKAIVKSITTPKEVANKVVEPIAKPEPVKVIKPTTETVTSTPTPLTKARLQLGAFGSQSEALKNWTKFQKSHAPVLGGKRVHVEKATVKGKDYFRVQAYPYGSKAEAEAACVMLKSKGQACFAVWR